MRVRVRVLGPVGVGGDAGGWNAPAAELAERMDAVYRAAEPLDAPAHSNGSVTRLQ